MGAFWQMMFFNPPISNNMAPLTASAWHGREVFLANGCLYCHSGFVRPQDVRVGLYYLYPRVSLPGDFTTSDSSPNIFGTARIGPDLTRRPGSTRSTGSSPTSTTRASSTRCRSCRTSAS